MEASWASSWTGNAVIGLLSWRRSGMIHCRASRRVFLNVSARDQCLVNIAHLFLASFTKKTVWSNASKWVLGPVWCEKSKPAPSGNMALPPHRVALGQKREPKRRVIWRRKGRKWCHARLWGGGHLLKALGSVAYYLADGIFYSTNDRCPCGMLTAVLNMRYTGGRKTSDKFKLSEVFHPHCTADFRAMQSSNARVNLSSLKRCKFWH